MLKTIIERDTSFLVSGVARQMGNLGYLRIVAIPFNAPPNNSFNPTALSLSFINLMFCDVGYVVSSSRRLIRALAAIRVTRDTEARKALVV